MQRDNLLFKRINQKFSLAALPKQLSKKELAYHILPHFLLELISSYLRVETEGESILSEYPQAIFIANHSGYMGFDALMLAHQIKTHCDKYPEIVAHKLWFLHPKISVQAEKFHLVRATLKNAYEILQKKSSLLLFPEGEEGNFKVTKYRYHLRRFRRGFVRLALMTGLPIIPAIVIGAEETHITLSQIRFAKDIIGTIIPIPLNILPLPVKWHICFLNPIILKTNLKKADDLEYVTKLSQKIRKQMQKEIHLLLKQRKTIFL